VGKQRADTSHVLSNAWTSTLYLLLLAHENIAREARLRFLVLIDTSKSESQNTDAQLWFRGSDFASIRSGCVDTIDNKPCLFVWNISITRSVQMLTFSDALTIYIAAEPIDMRKAIDGLTMLVSEHLKMDPQSCQLFVFYNKSRDKVKMIYWDKEGFVMVYKRMEKGRFKFPRDNMVGCFEINHEQLQWLLAGFDFVRLREHPELNFSRYF